MQTQIIPLRSHTYTDAQLLANQVGEEVTIAGVLRLVHSQNNPVVVLLHGSGGYREFIDHWVLLLNQHHFSTLVIDSFTGRGLTDVGANQQSLGRLASIADAYAALAYLKMHPQVDSQHIFLQGFSRGGQGALYAAMQRFAKRWGYHNDGFKAVASFYPNCCFEYLSDTEVINSPIRIFHGMADDYNPIDASIKYVERAKANGADIELFQYPDSHHGFDGKSLPTLSLLPNAQSTRNCRIIETQPGVLINKATGQPFTYQDPQIETGVHVGYNAKAATKAQQQLLDFFKQIRDKS
ncbi:dienelactone hydrolase family protein [Celerinatantimonas diazotrophica]|uniref:Dienelactone hydrolase n=1 Tax=Celerinatantimonas diazotrophica TaxID=412034 RepID=A0A4R1KGW8_9GAMM|nr:dienelactone hydrolase family protein [Celerinatantimonas diazotrophica]TCK63962.1 dienelactone hydrolase [Celerinatantimonas diazotrophica]CAG9297047.1 hypothetical protein CEDIAZO_02209 [Celerinatantimonas diazotrophica]